MYVKIKHSNNFSYFITLLERNLNASEFYTGVQKALNGETNYKCILNKLNDFTFCGVIFFE